METVSSLPSLHAPLVLFYVLLVYIFSPMGRPDAWRFDFGLEKIGSVAVETAATIPTTASAALPSFAVASTGADRDAPRAVSFAGVSRTHKVLRLCIGIYVSSSCSCHTLGVDGHDSDLVSSSFLSSKGYSIQ